MKRKEKYMTPGQLSAIRRRSGRSSAKKQGIGLKCLKGEPGLRFKGFKESELRFGEFQQRSEP